MTVLDNAPRDQYTATGGQTVFPYTFEIAAAGDIKVLQNGTLLNQGAGAGEYAVSGVGVDTGGNITLVTGATSGDIITIYRDMAYERLTAYTNAGDFLAADVNNDFDRLWLALQQNGGELDGRVLIAPNTDPTSIDMTIPDKAARLGKYLKFNDTTGNPEAGDVAGLYTAAGMNNYNFTGDGSTTAFTLGIAPGAENNTQTYIDGVYQQKDTYTVSGTTLTFSTAPPNLSTIEVMVIQPLAAGENQASEISFKQSGSSVERNAQVKLEESVSVADFGAVGDGVTDDTAAINAAADYMRQLAQERYIQTGAGTSSPHSVHGTCLYFPAGIYKCNSSVWLGSDSDGNYNDFVKNIYGVGAVILSAASNSVAVDMSGAYGCQIWGLNIWGLSGSAPKVGLLCARLASGASAGKHRFHGVKILGEYGTASFYNYGAEVNRFVNCEFRNIKADGLSTIYATSSNVVNPITSPNATLATGYQSSYAGVYEACDIHFDIESNNATITSATNAPVVIESIDYGPKFTGCYFDVLQGGSYSTPVVRFRSDPALGSTQKRTEGVSFVNCVFEDAYDSVLRMETTAIVQHLLMKGCSFGEASPSTADIVLESGSDFRRYEIQRYRGINTELVSYSIAGTLRESVLHSGFYAFPAGTTWYKNETNLTLDNNWNSLDVRSDLGVPNDPVKILLKVRVKTTSTPSDSIKAQFRGSSSDHDPADYYEIQPQVANLWVFSQGYVNVDSGGTIQYRIPSSVSEIDIKVIGYLL